MSLVVLGPAFPHVGRGVGQSPATDAATETLTRCRSSQRRYRNTLIFVAPDEGHLATARDVIRKSIAWRQIAEDKRLRETLTTGQIADAEDKAKTNRDSAQKSIRAAWSHIFFPVKSEKPGQAFDLEHSLISSRERGAIPAVVFDKVRADGIILEKLGTERLWLALKPIWPEDRAHLFVSEVADWFGSFVYLPKTSYRGVLEASIRDSVGKLAPPFGYAESYDEGTGQYRDLRWSSSAPEIFAPTAILVRAEDAQRQVADQANAKAHEPSGQPKPTRADGVTGGGAVKGVATSGPLTPKQPRRFYGSVEIDMVRPVKSFDAILNAVVMELQRTKGVKIKLTLEISAEADGGFADNDISVVRDNARQLKFKPESTGFDNDK